VRRIEKVLKKVIIDWKKSSENKFSEDFLTTQKLNLLIFVLLKVKGS